MPESRAVLELFPPYNIEVAVRELADFSHIWVLFVFHGNKAGSGGWRPTVRPPRLGGNRRIGVFASRSPFRPNPIGLSAVALERVETGSQALLLHLSGIDFLDQTPVLDIKPYLPYADSITHASGGFSTLVPQVALRVVFTDEARQFCLERERAGYPGLQKLIIQLLAQDPRPAYHQDAGMNDRQFGMKLFDFDIRWRLQDGQIQVTTVEDLSARA